MADRRPVCGPMPVEPSRRPCVLADHRELLDDAPAGAGMDQDGLYVPVVLATELEASLVVGSLLAGFIGGPLVGMGFDALLGGTVGWMAVGVAGAVLGIAGAVHLARRGKTLLRVNERGPR